MKLLLTWLVGVPALVAAMVMARAMIPQGMHTVAHHALAQVRDVQSCSGQMQFDQVLAPIPDDGHAVACNRSTVE